MPVTFDLGNGTSCHVVDSAQIIHTNNGPKQADQVQQGDYICNVKGEPYVEVVAPPVVS